MSSRKGPDAHVVDETKIRNCTAWRLRGIRTVVGGVIIQLSLGYVYSFGTAYSSYRYEINIITIADI